MIVYIFLLVLLQIIGYFIAITIHDYISYKINLQLQKNKIDMIYTVIAEKGAEALKALKERGFRNEM